MLGLTIFYWLIFTPLIIVLFHLHPNTVRSDLVATGIVRQSSIKQAQKQSRRAKGFFLNVNNNNNNNNNILDFTHSYIQNKQRQ